MAQDVVTAPVLSDDVLAGIKSFDDALAVVNDVFKGDIVNVSEEMGTGFGLLEDKSKLVGVPLVILEVQEHPGDFSEAFVSLTVVTRDGGKYIVNDGSTGIRDQIFGYWDQHPEAVTPGVAGERKSLKPFVCRHGFTESNYFRHPVTGDVSRKPLEGYEKARTYYLDLSA